MIQDFFFFNLACETEATGGLSVGLSVLAFTSSSVLSILKVMLGKIMYDIEVRYYGNQPHK